MFSGNDLMFQEEEEVEERVAEYKRRKDGGETELHQAHTRSDREHVTLTRERKNKVLKQQMNE